MFTLARPFHDSEPVLTIAEMRAAELGSPASESELMERAGAAAASAITAFCGPAPTLVLAGPGNNGGDGYVVARILAAAGWPVRVAALAPPQTETAKAMAAQWNGKTETMHDARPERVVVDAIFGTGLRRPLDPGTCARLHLLSAAASVRVALDLPSGATTDDGQCLSPLVANDLTIAFGALKPSHLLYPAAATMGRIVVADIGLNNVDARLARNGRPTTPRPAITAHKYQRGHVVVLSGKMPGAAWLAARAAQRAGAGYVTIAGDDGFLPSSLVVRSLAEIDTGRVDAVVIGPGLGSRGREQALLALALGKPSVLDGDIFSLFANNADAVCGRNDVMTPHEGEFARFFGDLPGSKVDRARAAAAISGNIIVLKGADTVIAAPDGRAAINAHASPRLATAGSGDVLAGILASRLASGEPPYEAACAAVWIHGDAALRGCDGLIAEDLIELLTCR